MDQIQSTQNVNLQSPMLAKTVQAEPKTVTPPEIKDGDNKSMQYLKYAGAALGAAALVGIACKLAKGKPIALEDIKWKDGKALLKEGSEAFSGKAVKKAQDGSKVITTFKDGVVVQQQKMGKNGFTRVYERDNNGKLLKMTQGDTVTLFERDKAGKLIKKTVGDTKYEYKYTDSGKLSAITENGKNRTVNNWQTNKIGDKDIETLANVRTYDADEKVKSLTEIKYAEKTGKKNEIIARNTDGTVVRSYDKNGKKISEITNKSINAKHVVDVNGKTLSITNNELVSEFSYDGKKITAYWDKDGKYVLKSGDEIIECPENSAIPEAFTNLFEKSFGIKYADYLKALENVTNHLN